MVHVPPDVAVERRIPSLATRTQLFGLRVASAAAGRLPRYEVGERICRIAAPLWYLAAPHARAAVQDNLRHVLHRPPTRREVLAVFWHGALNYWDTFALPHFTQAQIRELVDAHGTEHIDRARVLGRGVICAGAHLGSVAFAAQIVPALGYPTIGLVEPIQPPEVLEFFALQRQALGVRLLPVGAAALRELLGALRRNEVLGLVTDRDITGTGLMVAFFDAPTRFPDGPAALAVRTGAPILIAVATRKARGRFDAWFEPLPEVERTGETREDVLRLTQAIARRLEYYVANHPDQWTVFQRRWPEPRPG